MGGGRLPISDFKWSRDEEISNFPPGCVSVDRALGGAQALRPAPGSIIGVSCRSPRTPTPPPPTSNAAAEKARSWNSSLRSGSGLHATQTGSRIHPGVSGIINSRAFIFFF